MMFLDQILASRRARLVEEQAARPLTRLQKAAEARANIRDFAGCLAAPGLQVIAELKQASPSRGVLRSAYAPREIARGYEAAGAAALSVLTEADFFRGSLEDLGAAREAVKLPVLRKDFIIDPYQVYEAAAAGADAVLLIVAALGRQDLICLHALAASLGLAALVEVHTAEELARAADAGAGLIGVNNRNLHTFDVALETSLKLRSRIPAGALSVSESGIRTAQDLEQLQQAGYNAALIGERFMSAADPGQALGELLAGLHRAPATAGEKLRA
jgi:indole-3-glycerol phosphate synthase